MIDRQHKTIKNFQKLESVLRSCEGEKGKNLKTIFTGHAFKFYHITLRSLSFAFEMDFNFLAFSIIYYRPIFSDFRPIFFCSKSAEMKILLCKVGMGIKLYETKFFDLCSEKIELMK